jgi:hypothetical protein
VFHGSNLTTDKTGWHGWKTRNSLSSFILPYPWLKLCAFEGCLPAGKEFDHGFTRINTDFRTMLEALQPGKPPLIPPAGKWSPAQRPMQPDDPASKASVLERLTRKGLQPSLEQDNRFCRTTERVSALR